MSEQRQAVFIVDDDASVRKSLLRLFRSAGLHAESFASAHDFLNREHFDGNKCLVLDIRMPEVNGIDLFQKLSRAEYNLQVVFHWWIHHILVSYLEKIGLIQRLLTCLSNTFSFI